VRVVNRLREMSILCSQTDVIAHQLTGMNEYFVYNTVEIVKSRTVSTGQKGLLITAPKDS